jgi:hypothetical protein
LEFRSPEFGSPEVSFFLPLPFPLSPPPPLLLPPRGLPTRARPEPWSRRRLGPAPRRAHSVVPPPPRDRARRPSLPARALPCFPGEPYPRRGCPRRNPTSPCPRPPAPVSLRPQRPLPGGPPLPAPPTPRLAPSHRGLPPRASAARPGRVPPCLGHAPPAVLPVRARAPATHAPRVCTARVPSARATRSRACVRGRTALNLVLIHFNCCSVNMLHRALRRATNLSNFRFY